MMRIHRRHPKDSHEFHRRFAVPRTAGKTRHQRQMQPAAAGAGMLMRARKAQPTILIVPGLRGPLPLHWQSLLAERLVQEGRAVQTVPPMGEHLDCAKHVAALEAHASAIDGPLLLVAHSGGCHTVAHWASKSERPVAGALLAVPPDFERPMPAGFPTVEQLDAAGWLPLPRRRLPFPSLVASSSDDPLASRERVQELARDWGANETGLGRVGHLNPQSGYGEWPRALLLLALLRMP
jgi:predicted alpha/beta hydrolase family esterase